MSNIGVVVCLHGDEPVGLEVKKTLSLKLPVFIGNPQALKQSARFLEIDMNRCFPGKEDGLHEEKCANSLLKKIKDFDYIVDVHTSSGKIELFGIITQPNKEKMDMAKKMKLKKVVIMPEKFAKGAAMIDHLKCAVSLEVGPHGRKENAQEITEAINNLLQNIDSNCSSQKLEVLEIFEIIRGDKSGRAHISNFAPVRKGDLIFEDNEKHFAQFDFIPIFVGEDSYKNVICMAARKKENF